VQFEITELTRESVAAWISYATRRPEDFLVPSRLRASPNLSTRPHHFGFHLAAIEPASRRRLVEKLQLPITT
jgi:hypothetical protein